MKFLPLDNAHRQHYIDRLARLRADSRGQWGALNGHTLVAHLRRSVEIVLGDHEVADTSNWLTRQPWFIEFVFELMPWPAGKIQAPPVYLPAPVEDFEAEREALYRTIERFAAAAAAEPGRIGVSPQFVGMPLSRWTRYEGRHFEHHLRQFQL